MSIGTTARWQAAGLTERQIRTLVAQGRLIQIRHRVYATAELVTKGKADPRKEQALFAFAAILATSNPAVAVASHETAAAIHGLVLLNERQPDFTTLTRPPGNFRGYGRKIRFHSAELIPAHVTKLLGVPVTTVARTVVDIARSTVVREGVVIADAALRMRKTTKDDLNTVLDQCTRWPGIDQARRVISFSDGLSESPLESCARVTFEERGRGPRRAVAQLNRDQLLRETDRDVVHFTWQQLFYEEDRVITWLTRSFARPKG